MMMSEMVLSPIGLQLGWDWFAVTLSSKGIQTMEEISVYILLDLKNKKVYPLII